MPILMGAGAAADRLRKNAPPEEEAAKTDKATGEKSCCKGHGHKH